VTELSSAVPKMKFWKKAIMDSKFFC